MMELCQLDRVILTTILVVCVSVQFTLSSPPPPPGRIDPVNEEDLSFVQRTRRHHHDRDHWRHDHHRHHDRERFEFRRFKRGALDLTNKNDEGLSVRHEFPGQGRGLNDNNFYNPYGNTGNMFNNPGFGFFPGGSPFFPNNFNNFPTNNNGGGRNPGSSYPYNPYFGGYSPQNPSNSVPTQINNGKTQDTPPVGTPPQISSQNPSPLVNTGGVSPGQNNYPSTYPQTNPYGRQPIQNNPVQYPGQQQQQQQQPGSYTPSYPGTYQPSNPGSPSSGSPTSGNYPNPALGNYPSSNPQNPGNNYPGSQNSGNYPNSNLPSGNLSPTTNGVNPNPGQPQSEPPQQHQLQQQPPSSGNPELYRGNPGVGPSNPGSPSSSPELGGGGYNNKKSSNGDTGSNPSNPSVGDWRDASNVVPVSSNGGQNKGKEGSSNLNLEDLDEYIP